MIIEISAPRSLSGRPQLPSLSPPSGCFDCGFAMCPDRRRATCDKADNRCTCRPDRYQPETGN